MRAAGCLLLAGLSAFAQQNPCATAPYAQRDALLGEWESASGPVRYRKAVHGCAVIEDRPGSKALHFYDAAVQSWRTVRVGPPGVTDTRDEAVPAPATLRARAYPETAALPHPSCTHREFDFWLGQWNVYTPRGVQAGVNHIYSAAGGCLLVENWTNSALGTGLSFNFRDPKRGTWRQVWVAPGNILDLEGRFEGGVLRHRAASTRLSFTPHLDGSVRQYWEQTADGGKTWPVSFDGVYRRATPPAVEPLIADLETAAAATPPTLSAEVLGQLLAAEKLTAEAVRKLLALPRTANPTGFDAGSIEPLLGVMIANRNIRLAAMPAASAAEADVHAAFQRERQGTLELLRSAPAGSLRAARGVHPLGGGPALDAFQWLYALAAYHRRLLVPAPPSSEPASLRAWRGHWTGDGTFQGKPAGLELDIAPVLAGKFDELRAVVIQGGRRIFEGRALYAADLTASWADSAGSAYPVKGRFADGRLVSAWGAGDPPRGRSTYALDPASGRLEVIDEVRRADGSYVAFARYQVTRAPSPEPASLWQLPGLAGRQSASGQSELVVLDSPSHSLVLFGLETGATGQPSSADRDQIYVVESGRAVLAAGHQRIPLQPGSVAFVGKNLPRTLERVEGPLKVLVFGAKP